MPVPAVVQNPNPLELIQTRLQEAHELSAYEAIERLVRAGEEVGLDARSLVRMLDRGMAFEELFGVIESQMRFSPLAIERPARVSRAA
jgi:hypothetical protein